MKWNKAIYQIGKALKEGKVVEIVYHRKWMKNDSHIEQVEDLVEYSYNGWICYAVNLFNNQIDEGSHIIDEVIVKEGE